MARYGDDAYGRFKEDLHDAAEQAVELGIRRYDDPPVNLTPMQMLQAFSEVMADLVKWAAWYQEEEKKRERISVKESLPLDYKEVLFCNDDGKIFKGYHVSRVPQWQSDEGYYWHRQSYDAITHWWELPVIKEGE